jgi:hypothetical protein
MLRDKLLSPPDDIKHTAKQKINLNVLEQSLHKNNHMYPSIPDVLMRINLQQENLIH